MQFNNTKLSARFRNAKRQIVALFRPAYRTRRYHIINKRLAVDIQITIQPVVIEKNQPMMYHVVIDDHRTHTIRTMSKRQLNDYLLAVNYLD